MHDAEKRLVILAFLAGMSLSFPAMARDSASLDKLTAAAEKGDAEAQFELGKIYEEADGVKQDEVLAEQWLNKSAEQNDVDAQFYLGLVYRNRGVNRVAKDNIIAYMWFDIAAINDDDRAIQLRKDVADLLTNAQIEEAQKKSEDWRAKHPSIR